jgi:O-antigen ligase
VPWIGVALLGTLLLPPVFTTLTRAIVVRTGRLLEGKADSSARLRLVESWSMALRMARDSPVVGTGLGNFEQGLAATKQDLPDRELLGPETQGWNVLAHVLAVTGIVGLLLFLLFLAQLVPGRLRLAALFFLACFVQGSFLAAPFWVYWVVYLEESS